MSDITDTIAELERELLRIEKTPESYVGGSKAFYSGLQVTYKPSVQRKVDKLTERLNALYDQCEA